MKLLIDTSSLLSMVRYYLPFDHEKKLFEVFKSKVERGDVLILDKVFDECKYTAQGIVVTTFDFLKRKENQIPTTEILPDKKFFNMVEHQFVQQGAKKILSPVEFENRKQAFLESADAKMLLYRLQNTNEALCIVTEETESANDKKAFKKIPALCKILALQCQTLPQVLPLFPEIQVKIA